MKLKSKSLALTSMASVLSILWRHRCNSFGEDGIGLEDYIQNMRDPVNAVP